MNKVKPKNVTMLENILPKSSMPCLFMRNFSLICHISNHLKVDFCQMCGSSNVANILLLKLGYQSLFLILSVQVDCYYHELVAVYLLQS